MSALDSRGVRSRRLLAALVGALVLLALPTLMQPLVGVNSAGSAAGFTYLPSLASPLWIGISLLAAFVGAFTRGAPKPAQRGYRLLWSILWRVTVVYVIVAHAVRFFAMPHAFFEPATGAAQAGDALKEFAGFTIFSLFPFGTPAILLAVGLMWWILRAERTAALQQTQPNQPAQSAQPDPAEPRDAVGPQR